MAEQIRADPEKTCTVEINERTTKKQTKKQAKEKAPAVFSAAVRMWLTLPRCNALSL
jgi:hypothetical protein